jgi:hypothetical protein
LCLRSIYTSQVAIWLMILQWLQPRGTLATSAAALLAGAARRSRSGFRVAPAVIAKRGSGCQSYDANRWQANWSRACARF